MNVKELAKKAAEKEFKKEDMTNADYYAYEYFIKGFIQGYEKEEIKVEELPFGQGNLFEKY